MVATNLTIDVVLPVLKCGWVFFVGVCVICSFSAAKEAFQDCRYVKRHVLTEFYRIQAWQGLRHDGALLAFHTIIFLIRAWSLMWPIPGDRQFALDWAVDATCITAMQLLLAFSSLMDNADRRKMRDQIRRAR